MLALLPLLPLSLSLLLFSFPTSSSAQIGTTQNNVSSDSTQMTYLSTWRSTNTSGLYAAYSNDSDASVTFSFTGVGVSYVSIKKYDRGLCQLVVDGKSGYTIDLYDNSGYTQFSTVIWTSPTLPYGSHNVTLQQVGKDARIGYYPYLFSETWIEVVPTNIASYTATQILTTATTGSNPTSTGSSSHSSSSPDLAPIVGGAVGGVVALALIAFLIFLWRKDKRSKARGGGRMIQKVKRAEGKMSIEDDVGGRDGGVSGGTPYGRLDLGSGDAPGYGAYGRGVRGSYEKTSGGSGETDPSWGGRGYASHNEPTAQEIVYSRYGDTPPPVSSGAGTTRRESSAWGSEAEERERERDSRAYPYHTQGERQYPVPEI
ncbi:hypothetical protein P7C70_g4730, partial [Phenoliferia sp. Uapishka_3]